ncbi:MAG: glycosyltransferase family 2 protein [Acidimicrobiia bacterium]
MTRPSVAVVIPARNEERAIGPLLDSLGAQTYEQDRLEVVIADGFSTDATRSTVAAWDAAHPLRVRVVDNEQRVTASGLNAGIAATDADIVIVLGAHASVPADFVEASIRVLAESGADCAGGLLETVGTTPTGRAIAAATTSPFGVGNALFRTGTSAAARDVDTVAFAAYRRELFDRIGGFDVSLVGAEDDELNFRLVRSGGRIRFDPSIRSTYFCRTTLRGLARQYFMYGRGKAWVLKKHRRPPSVRMLAPAGLVGGLVAGLGASVALRRPLVLVPLLPYAAVVALGARRAGGSSGVSRPRTAMALMTLHVAYGVGLFVGAVRPAPHPRQSFNSSS